MDAAHALVRAMIHSRLYYCNSLLAGLPTGQMSRLQSVIRAAAQRIFIANYYFCLLFKRPIYQEIMTGPRRSSNSLVTADERNSQARCRSRQLRNHQCHSTEGEYLGKGKERYSVVP